MNEDTKLDKLLNHINVNDLFNFLKEYGAKHPGFKKELDSWMERVCLAPDNTKVFDLRKDAVGAFDESLMEGRDGEWLSLHNLYVNLDDVFESAKDLMEMGNPEPALAAYDEKLRWEAAQGTGRDRYRSIARSMRVMQSLAGGQAATHALAEFFRQTYRNRPAMMEIISEF